MQNYTENNDHRGVFQNNLYRIKKFVSFKGSSYSSGSSKESIILHNDGKFWEADNKKDSNFTISFTSHVMKISSLSLLSCIHGGCSSQFDVTGTNDGVYWDEVCQIRESYTKFFKNIANVPCSSNRTYRVYRLTQCGYNDNTNYKFPIHYLDFFGELFYIKIPQFTCFCRRRFSNNFLLATNIMLSII